MTNNVYIFGVGAAGSNILMNLAYSIPEAQFHVIDYDVVEPRNFSMGTQPYSKIDNGKLKINSLQRIILSINKKPLKTYNKKIESIVDILDIAKDGLIIDCFDNVESRNLFLDVKTDVVHVGFSGQMSGEVCWNESFEKMVSHPSDKNINICEYSLVKPFISSITGLASLVITEYVNTGVKRNVIFDKGLNLIKY